MGLCVNTVVYSLVFVGMPLLIGCPDFYSACQGIIMYYVQADFSLKLFKVVFQKEAYINIMPPFFRLDLLVRLCHDG